MSTASSVRRVKERTGGGERERATSTAGKISPAVGRSISAGKENGSRPTSRVRGATQKPQIQPMARIDKSAVATAVEEPPRVRKSVSSVPRGRSSSPSEFNRVLSDMRKNPSRVPVMPQRNGISRVYLGSGEKCRDFEKSGGGSSDEMEKRGKVRVERRSVSAKKDRPLSLGESKRSDVDRKVPNGTEISKKVSDELEQVCENKVRVLSGTSGDKEKVGLSSASIEKLELELAAKTKSAGKGKLRSVGGGVGLNVTESNLESESKVGTSSRESSAGKYPSKLHEKLAFLEGKVKRIATDIKKTKDMLDMNNPDASKMILSDIQEKISGIEKAMSHVVGSAGDSKSGLVKAVEKKVKVENSTVDAKSSIKGLNEEELEARLFPHHKLIRDRTLSKSVSEGHEDDPVKIGESNSAINVDEESSRNDCTVTQEFLASLSMEKKRVCVDAGEVQATDGAVNSYTESSALNVLNGKGSIDALLMADENLNDFDDQDTAPAMILEEEMEDCLTFQLNDIGCKTSTGGWFVSEGESVLLAHDDGTCTFYDIGNCEEKSVYKPPTGVSSNIWRDCWIIRAPSADGCSGRYVVSASAGNSADSGFCSWDFYTKEVRSFRTENETSHPRTALAPLANNPMYRRNSLSTYMASENKQWWYQPCGPLIVSTATCQRMVQIYDIRDGDEVMSWELQKPVSSMDYSSPLQWRNRGKVVLAESDSISLWDVSSLSSQALLSVSSSCRKISALHVNNTDAEIGGGVRQRISSSEAEGNDGVFCTPDFINVLDFRHPSGIGLKIPKIGVNAQSAFSRGDSIYIGGTNLRSMGKKHSSSLIQQFSLRKQKLFSTYALPESNVHHSFTDLTQVWGNSSHVMGVCGLGLFVFNTLNDDGIAMDSGNIVRDVEETIGPDDMYSPSFDYASSRVLLISRDRPAMWRYL